MQIWAFVGGVAAGVVTFLIFGTLAFTVLHVDGWYGALLVLITSNGVAIMTCRAIEESLRPKAQATP